jgi:hypothetical protein
MEKKNQIGYASVVVCFAIFILLVKTCSPSKSSTATSQENEDDLKNHAYITSQYIVKAKLKAPNSADFPTSYNSSVVTDTVYIESYVDAQNGFGANIRTYYDCTLHYWGGEWTDQKNWELLSLNLK